jgi:hypothetical protein
MGEKESKYTLLKNGNNIQDELTDDIEDSFDKNKHDTNYSIPLAKISLGTNSAENNMLLSKLLILIKKSNVSDFKNILNLYDDGYY